MEPKKNSLPPVRLDEKEHWARISSETLCTYSSSLSFFDAKGMRFHLPAFLIAELKGEYGMGLEFTLTHLNAHGCEKFSLLNEGQRLVVREYLQFLLKTHEADYYRDAIDKALAGFWSEELLRGDSEK